MCRYCFACIPCIGVCSAMDECIRPQQLHAVRTLTRMQCRKQYCAAAYLVAESILPSINSLLNGLNTTSRKTTLKYAAPSLG